MLISKALQIHSTAGAGYRAGTAALAQRIVYHSNGAFFAHAQLSDNLLALAGNRTIGADMRASQTAAANARIALSSAGVRQQLVLRQQADTLTAAAPACETVSGISFGPWHMPLRKIPAVGLSTGRSFGCAST